MKGNVFGTEEQDKAAVPNKKTINHRKAFINGKGYIMLFCGLPSYHLLWEFRSGTVCDNEFLSACSTLLSGFFTSSQLKKHIDCNGLQWVLLEWAEWPF